MLNTKLIPDTLQIITKMDTSVWSPDLFNGTTTQEQSWPPIFPNCTHYGSNCTACMAASSRCHFCAKDFACHAIGSYEGCAIGLQHCQNIEDCVRKEPQFIGYGPILQVLLPVICILITLAVCIGACSWFRTILCVPEESSSSTTASDKKDNVVVDVEEDVTEPLVKEDSEKKKTITSTTTSWKTNVSRVFWTVFWTSLLVLGVQYYPRIPDYNICNQKFDWESILQSLMSISPKVQYEVLLSVSNENRLGFELVSAVADIQHHNMSVGSYKLNSTMPWVVSEGSISDLLATIHLAPGFSDGIVLWKEFLQGKLIFTVDADVLGYIKWGDLRLYRIATSVKGVEFNAAQVTGRELCKCPYE